MDEVRVSGLKHQRRRAAMKHYAGLDVSVKETSVCVIDEASATIREAKVASEPEALLAVPVNDALNHRADWPRGGTIVAMALQRVGRGGLAGDLRRDPAYESGVAGADQQDRPQRCAWHRADDARGTLSPGANCCSRRPSPSITTCVGPYVTSASRWALWER